MADKNKICSALFLSFLVEFIINEILLPQGSVTLLGEFLDLVYSELTSNACGDQ